MIAGASLCWRQKIVKGAIKRTAPKGRPVDDSVILELNTQEAAHGRARKNGNDESSGEIDVHIQ